MKPLSLEAPIFLGANTPGVIRHNTKGRLATLHTDNNNVNKCQYLAEQLALPGAALQTPS